MVLEHLALGLTGGNVGEVCPECLTAEVSSNLLVETVTKPVVLRLLARTAPPVEEDVLDRLEGEL